MGVGDVFSTAKIRFVTDAANGVGRKWLKRLAADACEALSDLAQLGSVGIGAVTIFHAAPLVAAAILLGLAMGSMTGTELGQRLADRWDIKI